MKDRLKEDVTGDSTRQKNSGGQKRKITNSASNADRRRRDLITRHIGSRSGYQGCRLYLTLACSAVVSG